MQKALILRYSAIGDCVMTAWPVTGFAQANPEIKITWVVANRCAPVIANPGLAHDLVTLHRDRRAGQNSISSWMRDLKLYLRLRRERFDIGFDMQGHVKTGLALKVAKPKLRIAAPREDWLARSLNPQGPNISEGEHQIEHLYNVMRSIADFKLPERPVMPSPLSVRALNELRGEGPLITIQTGGSHEQKIYPSTSWAKVVNGLPKAWRIVALGASGDPQIDHPRVTDLVGELSLAESVEAVRRSHLHLAGDTGTGHVAAAYGVPSVAIMGHLPKSRFRPYSDRSIALQEGDQAACVSPEQVVQASMEAIDLNEQAVVY